ncbi:hypothetical protein D9M70_382460 [compost metagenome]
MAIPPGAGLVTQSSVVILIQGISTWSSGMELMFSSPSEEVEDARYDVYEQRTRIAGYGIGNYYVQVIA